MFFKPSHILQDIQYDAIGIRGGYYSRLSNSAGAAMPDIVASNEDDMKNSQEEIDSVFLMNNELIYELYSSSLGVFKTIFAYIVPFVCFYMTYLIFQFTLPLIGEGQLGVFTSFLLTMTLIALLVLTPFVSYRVFLMLKNHKLSFLNSVFRRFKIKLINFSTEDKKNSQIGLAALFNVLKNSKYEKAVSYNWEANVKGENHLNNNLECAVISINLILKTIRILEKQDKILAKQKEKEDKIKLKVEKEKTLLATTNEDIQDRIKSVYFD